MIQAHQYFTMKLENEKLIEWAKQAKEEIMKLETMAQEQEKVAELFISRLAEENIKLKEENKKLKEELEETILENDRYEAECDEMRWNIEGLEEMLDA